MRTRRADDVAAAVSGRLSRGDADTLASGVSIDSRTTTAGDVFVAIRGPRHDGHDFARAAEERGATMILAERDVEGIRRAAVVLVDDTTDALGALAADERRSAPIKVVAITGSAGKTTTRELTGVALASRYATWTSEGNLNNQWGLPLSLLRVPDGTDVAVLEMGMNHAGEIAALTRIAAPDVGVITNVGSAHLGFFRDTRELAAAKVELLDEMPESATGVVNADSPLLMELAQRSGRRLLRFGFGEDADVRGSQVGGGLLDGASFVANGVPVRLGLWGDHAVQNALAALGAAVALDVPIADAAPRLREVRPMEGRGRLHALVAGSLLVDDSYNSNPSAVRSVAESLSRFEWRGRRVAVLGDMLELGDQAAEQHREVGRELVRLGFKRLLAVGAYAGDVANGAREGGLDEVSEHIDAEEACETILHELAAGDLILIKGSRGVRLERVVHALVDRFGDGARP